MYNSKMIEKIQKDIKQYEATAINYCKETKKNLIEVVLVTAEWCVPCRQTKEFLLTLNINNQKNILMVIAAMELYIKNEFPKLESAPIIFCLYDVDESPESVKKLEQENQMQIRGIPYFCIRMRTPNGVGKILVDHRGSLTNMQQLRDFLVSGIKKANEQCA